MDYPTYLLDAYRFLWFFNQLPVFCVGIVLYHSLKFAPKMAIATARMGVYVMALILMLIATFAVPKLLPGHINYAVAFGLFAFFLARYESSLFVNSITTFMGKIG